MHARVQKCAVGFRASCTPYSIPLYECIMVYFLYMQESGVTLMIRGQDYTFRGTLALVSGDNLASHYLGGYNSL